MQTPSPSSPGTQGGTQATQAHHPLDRELAAAESEICFAIRELELAEALRRQILERLAEGGRHE